MPPRPRPFYYLENFHDALSWLKARYADLLVEQELAFIDALARMPTHSAALLVRMIMRRGELFRTSKLRYAEIGAPEKAAAPLVELGWIDPRPPLSLEQLCSLLRRDELQAALSLRRRPRIPSNRSRQLALDLNGEPPRPLEKWWCQAPDRVLRVSIAALCERLRLMFFGNFQQDWSTFVLADLGIQHYERVAIHDSARAFRTREHIDHFHALYQLRERIDADEPAEDVLAAMPPAVADCPWIEARRSKLIFSLGQRLEKAGRLSDALSAYRGSAHPEARVRAVRVLERMGDFAQASALLASIERESASELEAQRASKMRPRLQRKLGLERYPTASQPACPSFEVLLVPDPVRSVEELVREHLADPSAPAIYVENALINSLFGLLFWDAIFAPVPGAFFHPFQSAPVDLLEADFRARRAESFATCFAQLDSGAYRQTILEKLATKHGIQAPFVAWGLLTRELLDLALSCIPPAHLRALFERLLADLQLNRTGLPDLIQFWPDQGRYRMIEVKAPGDRLQDNQVRWLRFCAANGIPAQVCHVRWVTSEKVHH